MQVLARRAPRATINRCARSPVQLGLLLLIVLAPAASGAQTATTPASSIAGSTHTDPSLIESSSSPEPDENTLLPAPTEGETFPPAEEQDEKPGAVRYTISVRQVPIEQLLHALARDAQMQVAIHPGLQGRVSLSASNVPLADILERIAQQVNMRFDLQGNSLTVAPDTPYTREYAVDQLNLVRRARTSVSSSTSIAPAGGGAAGAGQNNASSATIDNMSENQPWKVLEQNIRDLLRGEAASAAAAEHSPVLPAASVAGPPAMQTPDVVVNAEAGLIAVRATSRQHRHLKDFLYGVQSGLARQVVIEATLVEVVLDKSSQAGVDWSHIGRVLGGAVDFRQTLVGSSFAAVPLATLTLGRPDRSAGGLHATLRLLETFGRTRVLSSPKLTVLNNQMALLKVVDERVYFEVKATRTEARDNDPARIDYSSSVKSVPVGVMMTVLPQISRDGVVSLNVRPTITRITSYKTDPAAAALGSSVSNLVPEIQVREIESTLRLRSGQTAVLGGLMQESTDEERIGVPWLMNLPLVGHLFSFRRLANRKTELVIFLRPEVIDVPPAAMPATARHTRTVPAVRLGSPFVANLPFLTVKGDFL